MDCFDNEHISTQNSGNCVSNDLTVSEEIKEEWEREQVSLKRKWSPHDCDIINLIISSGQGDKNIDVDYYIGGVDISYIKGDNVNACAALVVLRLRDLKVVYEDFEMVKLTAPYIPGFLAFREVQFLLALFDKLKNTNAELYPHVTMVDGNGYLHVREFGLACHLGVMLGIPTIGVAKNLYQIDGLEKNDEHRVKILQLSKSGDKFPLVGKSGKTYGFALRSCDNTTNPIYISVGHMISLDSAVDLVHRCCRVRVPEPVRWADLRSKEYIRVNHPGAS